MVYRHGKFVDWHVGTQDGELPKNGRLIWHSVSGILNVPGDLDVVQRQGRMHQIIILSLDLAVCCLGYNLYLCL